MAIKGPVASRDSGGSLPVGHVQHGTAAIPRGAGEFQRGHKV